MQLALLGIAIGANALSALAGGGAGLVQLPALILLGLPFSMALATHKVASVALGLGASGRHWRASSLDLKRSALVLAAGLPGVFVGASMVLALPDQVATASLGLLTLGLGVYSARKPIWGRQTSPTADSPHRWAWQLRAVHHWRSQRFPHLRHGVVRHPVAGALVWAELRQSRCSHPGAGGPGWNGTGALVLGLSGEIRWDWLPPLVLGSLIGGFLGAHYSLVKGSRLVKKAFEVLALLMGGSLLIRSF